MQIKSGFFPLFFLKKNVIRWHKSVEKHGFDFKIVGSKTELAKFATSAGVPLSKSIKLQMSNTLVWQINLSSKKKKISGPLSLGWLVVDKRL